MRLIFAISLVLLAGYGCQQEKKDSPVNPVSKDVSPGSPRQLVYDAKYDSLADGDYFDTLYNMSVPENADAVYLEKESKVVQDSINNLYDQLMVRLNMAAHVKDASGDTAELRKNLELLRQSYGRELDARQNLVFYSYGTASERSVTALSYRLYLLRRHLFFLKAIFNNAFYNFGFDRVNEK